MASTRGAIFLAESEQWMAAHREQTARLERIGTLIETALTHMDDLRRAAFCNWLADALEGLDCGRIEK